MSVVKENKPEQETWVIRAVILITVVKKGLWRQDVEKEVTEWALQIFVVDLYRFWDGSMTGIFKDLQGQYG